MFTLFISYVYPNIATNKRGIYPYFSKFIRRNQNNSVLVYPLTNNYQEVKGEMYIIDLDTQIHFPGVQGWLWESNMQHSIYLKPRVHNNVHLSPEILSISKIVPSPFVITPFIFYCSSSSL